MFRTICCLTASLFALCPISSAQVQCASENDGPVYEDLSSTGNAWFAIKFVAPSSFSVSRLEIFTGETTAASALDLWQHDANTGLPSTLLASAAFTIQPTNGWQGATFSSPVAIGASTTYWIVWHAVLGAQASLDQPGAQNGAEWCVSVDMGQNWIGPAQSTDRQWKYRVFGDCCSQSVPYCTAGTTSHGCLSTLSSTGIADADAGSGFVVTASNVEGQKQGLFFYGLSGPLAQPWGPSSSFLCVKPPTQRTATQSSSGTLSACDGVFVLDWNSYITVNPSALGAPFAGGESVWIQAWFRDPPSPKTTNLSDGLRFTVCP